MGPNEAKMRQVGAKLGAKLGPIGAFWGHQDAEMLVCWNILAFPVRKLIFLQKHKGPERSLGGIRGYFWLTWEQKWFLECQVGAKMKSIPRSALRVLRGLLDFSHL